MYKVLINNVVVKEYPYELQVVTYCFMNNYVTRGRNWYFLNPKVKIVRECNNGM